MSLNSVTCPTNCSFEIPAVSFSDCLRQGDFAKSRIVRIYISTVGFTDVSDASEWANRLKETPTNPDDIRELRVIGNKPKPEPNTVILSDYRKVTLSKNHTLNAKVDITNAINEVLINFFECNPTVHLWYQTEGNRLFGGNDGILAQVELDRVLDEDENGVERYELVATWKKAQTEQSIVSPIPVSF